MNQASRPTFYPLHPDFVKSSPPLPIPKCKSDLSSSVQQNFQSSSVQQNSLSASVQQSVQSLNIQIKEKAQIKMESIPLPKINNFQQSSAYIRTMLFSQP